MKRRRATTTRLRIEETKTWRMLLATKRRPTTQILQIRRSFPIQLQRMTIHECMRRTKIANRNVCYVAANRPISPNTTSTSIRWMRTLYRGCRPRWSPTPRPNPKWRTNPSTISSPRTVYSARTASNNVATNGSIIWPIIRANWHTNVRHAITRTPWNDPSVANAATASKSIRLTSMVIASMDSAVSYAITFNSARRISFGMHRICTDAGFIWANNTTPSQFWTWVKSCRTKWLHPIHSITIPTCMWAMQSVHVNVSSAVWNRVVWSSTIRANIRTARILWHAYRKIW